jgi:hypothetical protein
MAETNSFPFVTQPQLWREVDRVDRRIDEVDDRITEVAETGTRPIIGLSEQMASLSREITRLEKEIQSVRSSMAAAGRYWLTTVLAFLAIVATVVVSFLK